MSLGTRSPYSSHGSDYRSHDSHYESRYGRPACSYSGYSVGPRDRYRPRFDPGSHRPRHDTSLWRENSYRPLFVRTHSNNGRGKTLYLPKYLLFRPGRLPRFNRCWPHIHCLLPCSARPSCAMHTGRPQK